jgi:hypothetical protein
MQTENKGGKRTSRSMIPKEHWNVYWTHYNQIVKSYK